MFKAQNQAATLTGSPTRIATTISASRKMGVGAAARAQPFEAVNSGSEPAEQKSLTAKAPPTSHSNTYVSGAIVAGAATAALLFIAAPPDRQSSESTIALALGSIRGEEAALQPNTGALAPLDSGSPLGSLVEPGRWLNVPSLQPEDLQGKVVLVNFWTYSCINSLRPLPFLKAWAEKYKERGLVVVGVHTPEFEFEKDFENVKQAAGKLGIKYPVRLDNNFGTWRSFENRAWPGFYFIDANGRVRHQTFGEGDYAAAERLLQKLLSEADGKPAMGSIGPISGEGIQAAPNWAELRTPETYVGYARFQNFASPGGVRKDVFSQYQDPLHLPLNHWSLGGKWQIGREFAMLGNQPGHITYRFHARDLHLVLGTRGIGQPVSFRVTIDGAAPGRDHGVDIDEQGWGTVREDRLYQLVRQQGPVADRTFQIEFLAPGVRAYAFTFG